MIRKGECTLPGQSAKKFDIEAPFAVQRGYGREIRQVVVKDTGCPGVNSLVALTVLARAERGDLEEADGDAGKWFGSRLRLTLS